MVLKTPIEGSIKIATSKVAAGEKAASEKAPSERAQSRKREQREQQQLEKEQPAEKEESKALVGQQAAMEPRSERRRDRRRGFRRRRGQGQDAASQGEPTAERALDEEQAAISSETPYAERAHEGVISEGDEAGKLLSTTPMLSSILPPPTTLIRDDLERLRKHEAYKSAFYREGEFDESELPNEPYDFSERDIEMKEGGDQGGPEGVPPEEPFRDGSTEELFPEAKKVDSP